MTHDHSPDNMEQTDTAEGNVSQSAPSASEAGAHSGDHHTHSGHDHNDHGHGDDHDAHAGHGSEDDSEKSTLVPVTWRQLVFPALILLLVAILLIGPVSGAFAPRPATAPTNTEQPIESTPGKPTVAPTSAPGGSTISSPVAQVTAKPTNTVVVVQAAPPTNTAAPPPVQADAVSPEAAATRTAVAVLGEEGKVSRAPTGLAFAGARFTVDAADSGILPDWKPSGDPTHATWIRGTYANHIIYMPYSDTNAALFTNSKPGDIVKLTMDNGQVFEFQVTRSERASNGPPTSDAQFTVTTAMNQDHAGVTLFLVGDPAVDRAVVQADFTGNIQ